MDIGSPQPEPPAVRHGTTPGAGAYKFPISRLGGVPTKVRLALRAQRITTCQQLLAAAAEATAHRALALLTQIYPNTLTAIVQRADIARVNGVGAVFGLMLAGVGVADVADLAAADPVRLHARLHEHNACERLARRSPTPEEVADWVAQARRLPVLVSYEPQTKAAAGR